MIRTRQAIDAFEAVVNVAKGTRLLAIGSDLDLVVTREFGDGRFATHGCRRLLPATLCLYSG